MDRKTMVIIGLVVGIIAISTYIAFGTPLIKNMMGGNKNPPLITDQKMNGNYGSGTQQMGERMKPILDGLVKDGTLTKEKADALTTYLNENQPARPTGSKPDASKSDASNPQGGRGSFQNLFAGAVEKGIITQEESNLITAKFRTGRQPQGEKPAN